MDNLEKLVPVEAAVLEHWTTLEIADVIAKQQSLLDDAAGQSNDDKLQATIRKAKVGHIFDQVNVRGKGTRNLNGDSILKR